MADPGRIDKRFYKHAKAIKARSLDPGSISLWIFANCYCRNHRKQGLVPFDKARELGTESEIQALVDSGLWLEVDEGYRFNDWDEWNPDQLRETLVGSAAWIVHEELSDHPEATKWRMTTEVKKLLSEGMTASVIRGGLRKWCSRAEAPVGWLSFFVSDVLRDSNSGVAAVLAEAKRTGVVGPLAAFGFRWHPPCPPPDATVSEIRKFNEESKRKWLSGIEVGLQHGR